MMNKLKFLILFLLIPSVCFAAEFLVRAKPHWMDSLTQVEVDKMSAGDKQSYEARSQVGDIVVVRPDNWQWGKEECLPNFVVVKVPQMTEAEAKQYEQPLTKTETVTHPINGESTLSKSEYDRRITENDWADYGGNTPTDISQEWIDKGNILIDKVVIRYSGTVTRDEQIMLRLRKYSLPKVDIETAKTNKLNSITLTKTVLISKTITKTGASSEIVQPGKNIVLMYWRRITKKVNPYLNTAFNFWVKKCFAAEFLKKTVKPSGGDYTSLEACMNANEQDLTGDGWFTVEIDGTWSSADTTAVVVHNYTTTSSDYINIYTTATARHTGTRGTGYRLIGSGVRFTSQAGFITLNGVEAQNTNAWADMCIRAYDDNTICNNLLYDSVVQGGYYALYCHWISRVKVYNNIVIGMKKDPNTTGGNGFECNGGTGHAATMLFYGNTVYYCAGAGFTVQDATVKNNLSYNNGGDDFHLDTNVVEANNFSEDDTAGSDNGCIRGITDGKTPDFVDTTAGAEDLHLQSTSDAIDVGTDLGAPYNVDIDGDTRVTFDIGADEYVGGAPPAAVDDSQVFIISMKEKWTSPKFWN